MGFAKGSTLPTCYCARWDGVKALSFGCQGCLSPLCDNLPELHRKLIAVTRQPLIKCALRPLGRLLGRFLVLRRFALVPLQSRFEITQHGAAPRNTT
jgi:hypothetical protein